MYLLQTCHYSQLRSEFFLLFDLRGKNSVLGSTGRKKALKMTSSENDQLTGHFQSFF